MRDRVFLDSNIFLYAFNTDDDKIKQQKAAETIMSDDYSYVISIQVINEVSSNMLRKLSFVNSEVKEFVEDSYMRYNIQNITKNIFVSACDIRDKYNLSYYDSLIVSSAINSDCKYLYSEDMQSNQKIGNLTIINPFNN